MKNLYLYCLFTNGGIMYLCRYDSDLSERKILYSFPFGVSVFDIDVSHDGSKVSPHRRHQGPSSTRR